MALISTTINDLTTGTAALTISSGTAIENITYTKSSNTVAFTTQNAFTLSPSDFLIFRDILDIFDKNLVNVFSPGHSLPNNFSVSQITDTNNGTVLSFGFYQTNHPVYSITSTYPAGSCAFAKRNQAITLSYDEWQYYHTTSLHYEQEVKQYYHL